MTRDYPSSPASARQSSPASPGSKLAYHLNGQDQPMDGRQAEYSQPGLTPDYQNSTGDALSEHRSPDPASAQQYQQSAHDPRSATFSPQTATPTSEYGIAPASARSGSFPDYIQRPYQAPGASGANAGGMAQATSPSMSLPNGTSNSDVSRDMKSDPDLAIDPSIAAATSPTYPHQPQYSPYTPQHDMYHGHPGVYARPDWATGPGQPHPGYHGLPPYGHGTSSAPPTPALVSPGYQGGHTLSTVYSFVPIPGSQQHKRPRRRYEEIERMYKCGWQGCEKAYGTLNHLNAHVTMQSHGQKRTPDEFKEIRKEWKAKKKEEELTRKADEERTRSGGDRDTTSNGPDTPVYGHIRTPIPTPTMPGASTQLPPIGFTPSHSQAPTYGQQSPAMDGNSMYGDQYARNA